MYDYDELTKKFGSASKLQIHNSTLLKQGAMYGHHMSVMELYPVYASLVDTVAECIEVAPEGVVGRSGAALINLSHVIQHEINMLFSKKDACLSGELDTMLVMFEFDVLNLIKSCLSDPEETVARFKEGQEMVLCTRSLETCVGMALGRIENAGQ